MAKKDFTITENHDLGNHTPAEKEPGGGTTPATPSDKIKNAHATGDGSFGRSESSLPEENEVEDKVKKGDSNY